MRIEIAIDHDLLFVAELLGGEFQMLVERGPGGRDAAAQVQGPRVAGCADG